MRLIVRRAGARDFVPENTDGEHQWRNLIAHGKVLKAEADGTVVGVASLASTFHFIHKLFVRPGYRGPGVGRLLLERLPRTRLGFRRYRFVRGYYRRGEDRYIMRWEGAGTG